MTADRKVTGVSPLIGHVVSGWPDIVSRWLHGRLFSSVQYFYEYVWPWALTLGSDSVGGWRQLVARLTSTVKSLRFLSARHLDLWPLSLFHRVDSNVGHLVISLKLLCHRLVVGTDKSALSGHGLVDGCYSLLFPMSHATCHMSCHSKVSYDFWGIRTY